MSDQRTIDAIVTQLAEQIVERLRAEFDCPSPVLVDAEAAARLLSIPKTWLLAEARAGRAPHRKLGKYVRFSPSELAAWCGAGCGPVPPRADHPTNTGVRALDDRRDTSRATSVHGKAA